MKNSKKTSNGVGQNTAEVKKSQKHDANLQKNSTLYFQIGLILCLLGTYALFEMQFQEQKFVIETIDSNELATIDVAPDFRVKVEQKSEPKPKVERSNKIIEKIKEVPDETKTVEKELFTTDSSDQPSEPANPGDFSENNEPAADEVFVPFPLIEKVPIYPGCEKYDSNEARKKCMSNKITKLVGRKFNTSVGERYGITGLQKIQTQFTVDKNGNVTDVKVRAPHPALEKEAKRVIDKIPHMKPGIQRDKPVGVIYTLPITFQVNN